MGKYEKNERDILLEIKRVNGVEGRKPTPPTGKDFVESRGIRYHMKYGSVSGSTSETMILVSAGSEFQSDIQFKRRVRNPAMAEKAINWYGRLPTIPITLQEETAADLMARASLILQDTTSDLVRLCLDVPGKQRSKQYYLQAIEEFFKNCRETFGMLINPRHACAARVIVVVLSFCLSVCLSVCLLPRFLPLRATRRPISDSNGFSATLALF